MNKPLGYDDVIERLTDLPSALLVQGPRSVGKMTLCRYLSAQRTEPCDTFQAPEPLHVEASRDIGRFLQTHPFGRSKSVLVRLDGASESALNALLKALEEPPEYGRFLLTSSRKAPLTIESRSTVVRVGFLDDDTLSSILQAHGFDQKRAMEAAVASDGTVQVALEIAQGSLEKGKIVALVEAAKEGNRDRFSTALTRFDRSQLRLLRRWAHEVRTGRFRVFKPEDSMGLESNPKLLNSVTTALGVNARPRTIARAALLPVLEGS